MGLLTERPSRAARLAVAACAVWAAVGSLLACGSAGGVPSGEEPPSGKIGFVGGIGSGVGFVGGGKGHHDAGSYPVDAPSGPDAGGHGDAGSSLPDSGEVPDGGQVVDAGDGGSGVGVTIDVPPGFFPSLDWSVSGPAGSYSGTIHFGASRSHEFVIGGIQAGPDYTITLTGRDPSGDFCTGTSAPFTVSPGATTGAGVTMECFTGDGGARAADVTTGNIAVDASVVMP